MVTGFVLITAKAGEETKLYHALAGKTEELYLVFGEYDLLARVETKDHDELGRFILDEIKSLEGVLNMRILTAIDISEFRKNIK